MAAYVKNKAIGIIDNLLNTKSIVSFMLTVCFCVLAIRGKIGTDNFMLVFTMVMSFHFGTHVSDMYLKDKQDKENKRSVLSNVSN